ncbi:MAG: DUF2959 domain-containing protein [Bdellovibrionales bacterium]|nr:DUF2959 domain-containing protein [Bdellovibrionales bacterium]
MKLLLFIPLTGFFLVACQSAVNKVARNAKYSAWEVVGVEKRDLFKREVANAKEDQEETGEAFKDALTKLKEVYSFDGGNLEKSYNSLNSSYRSTEARVNDVKGSIQKMETVAGDLFEEWSKEISQISTADLRTKSKASLDETKAKYQELHKSLKTSEAKMKPVLTKFKDQVLYLKHNLNAKAVGSLKKESVRIEKDIQALMVDMNRSIANADQVIREL